MSRTVTRQRVCGLVSLGLVLALTGAAGAQMDYFWDQPAGGVFGDGGNWTPPGPPGPADRAAFTLNNAYTVTFDGAYVNDTALLTWGRVTLDLAGFSYTLAHLWDGTPSVSISDNFSIYSSALLTVLNGQVWATELEIGRWQENSGELVVGAGATWTGFMHFFDIGVSGKGTLTVRDGGICEYGNGFVAFQPRSAGVVDVSGLGSLWHVTGEYILGREGQASMTVRDGATASTGRSHMGQLSQGSGVAVIDGPGSLWRVQAYGETGLHVGDAGAGMLTVRNGGTVVNDSDGMVVGSEASGSGLVTVTGAGSVIRNSWLLSVGEQGLGQVTIEDGGRFQNGFDVHLGGAPGVRGQVTVTGAGSALEVPDAWTVFVGSIGEGVLEVRNGGRATCGQGSLGRNVGSKGTALVDGAGSVWSCAESLYVGGDSLGVGGTGELTVSNGGQVNIADALRVYAGGTVYLTGSGIRADNETFNEGRIELSSPQARLEGGALVNTGLVLGTGTVACQLVNPSAGQIEVPAGGRLVFTESGNASAGRISVLGGTLEFTQDLLNDTGGNLLGRGTFIVRGGLTNKAYVALSSGVSEVFGDVANNPGGSIVVSGQADATFYDDVQNSGSFKVAAGASGTFFGAFSGSGISGGGDVYFEADVTPGFSPGRMDFGGNVWFSNSSCLLAEVGGTAPGSGYDQVNIASTAGLDGAMAVSLYGGFSPQIGDRFAVVTCGRRAGEFALITGWRLADKAMVPVYAADGLDLVTTYYGDTNADVDVDFADYQTLEGSFGKVGAAWADGDFDGDGDVDFADYQALEANFGFGPPPGQAIPEPAALGLLCLAAPMLKRRRR